MLSLPFIDDFAALGPYPAEAKWTDDHVFINQTYGIDPVSLGVASFDGIDKSGAPYGGGYGPSDTLTSGEINLLGANPNNLFLTFYIQAGGLSFRPELEDSLVLQFKDGLDRWLSINSFTIEDYSNLDSFYFITQGVNAAFFHTRFQFRFINYSDNEGATDVWNLDYVKLAEEAGANFQRETDLAITVPPQSFLKEYRAMPWRHFRGFESRELDSFYTVELFNHNNIQMQADSTFFVVGDLQTFRIPVEETLLELPPTVPENQRDLPPGRHRFTNAIKTDDFVDNFSLIFNEDEENLSLTKAFIFRQVQAGPQALRRNNLATTRVDFNNYFAYDDGTAESGIQFNFGGTDRPAVAVQFRSNVADTIAAIQCMFPHASDDDRSQVFRFAIWGTDINAGPIYQSADLSPVFVHEELGIDTIQGITTFKLKSPITGNDTVIAVDEGIFYVGWYQINSGPRGVQIGFDLNSPEASGRNFYFNGSQWVSLSETSPFFNGVPIIRPVMAPYNGTPTPIYDPEFASSEWSIYPNPTSGLLNLQLDDELIDRDLHIELFDNLGRMLKSGKWMGQINLDNQNDGNYWLRLKTRDGRLIGVKPVIVTKQ